MFAILLPIALHAGLADPAALARETKAFAGTWAVTGMVMNGIEIPEGAYKGMRFEFAENKVNAYHGKDPIADGKFKVVGVLGDEAEDVGGTSFRTAHLFKETGRITIKTETSEHEL